MTALGHPARIKAGAKSFALAAAALLGACAGLPSAAQTTPDPTEAPPVAGDPYLWLEGTGSKAVDDWVAEQNAATLETLAGDPRFEAVQARFLKALSNPQNTPELFAMRQYRGFLYMVRPSPGREKGDLARISVVDYAEGKKTWEPLVDLDRLSAEDGRNWFVYFSNIRFSPDGTRMLLALTDGGEDAVAIREYDLAIKSFVEGGFATEPYRQTAEWIDDNTILIGAAIREQETSIANYSTVVRRWERGKPLADAEIVFQVDKSHIMASTVAFQSGEARQLLLADLETFEKPELYAYSQGGELTKLDIPASAFAAFTGLTGVGRQAVISLQKEGWSDGDTTYPAGSIIALDIEKMLEQEGRPDGAATLVYTPEPDEALVTVSASLSGGKTMTSDAIYLNIMENVVAQLKRISLTTDSEWEVETLDLPSEGALDLPMYGDRFSTDFLLKFQNYLTPPQLYLAGSEGRFELVDEEAATSDLSHYVTEQYFATADDGVRVPYFVTRRKDMEFDGTTPVLMLGYGAFGLPMTPAYRLPFLGAMPEFWLEQGGAFVAVSPRGGGEYGPAWHQAAQLRNRQRSYDDIYAVVQDLLARDITAPGKTAWIGSSNGGLTAGVVATQRPDLFGASIALVPLADMMRYHKLLAGPSWMPEYGNPDIPEDRAVLLSYSPYHNVDADKGVAPMLYMTSTKDDRVHPGHARKMTAKLEASGQDVLFYEEPQGGHMLSATPASAARISALQAIFLMQQLMDEGGGGK